MDNIYKLIIILFLINYSQIVLSDTYPAVTLYADLWVGGYPFNTGSESCSSYLAHRQAQQGTSVYTNDSVTFISPNHCTEPYQGTIEIPISMSCPNGGTIDGNSCINAPICVSPEQRQSVSPYACYTPSECAYPESDNGNGICQVNSCPTGQNRNPQTNLCQTPPTCGSTEMYDLNTNTCFLKTLSCPTHSHPNAANDQCLADAPMACPSGQHDNGTYTCVADDISACGSNQQAGYINGIPQCITKPNLDTAQQAAADAAANQTSATNDLQTAAIANETAQTNLAADPTNTTLQAIAKNAEADLETAKAEAQKAAAEAAQAAQAVQSDYLNSIDQTLKNSEAKDDADRAAGFGTIPEPETVNETEWTASVGNFGSSGSCPAPAQINTSFGTIEMSYEYICDFATMIRPIIITFAWLTAALITFGAVKE